MKPRLLVLSSTYPRFESDPEPGFVHELAKRLTDRFEVHVLCPHCPDTPTHEVMQGVFVHRYRYAPFRLETLVRGGGILSNLKHHRWKWMLVPFFMCAQLYATSKMVHRLRPACIHAHWIIPQGIVIALLRAAGLCMSPILLTSHGGDLYALKGGVLARLKGWVLAKVDRVTVVSNAMHADVHALGLSPSRIDTAPMGVDFCGRFTPSSAEPRNHDELLFVGRLVEKKGLHVLISALPAIAARHPGIRVTVAGYGPEREALRSLALRTGVSHRIEFVGAVSQEQLVGLYRRATLFVAPFVAAPDGDREGLGLVTIEATACGCPVVVSALPAVLDLLDPAKDSEALTTPGDPSQLASRIISRLDHPEQARRHARELRERLQARFEWRAVALRYDGLLGALQGESGVQ